jgi:photosystem II stability/assembly factor-like uncharacterized protein
MTIAFLPEAFRGGLWESSDNGQSWTAVNENAANLSVTCITSNPFNHDIIYYGTGEASGNSAGISGIGIYKSTDRGKSWELLESSSIPELSLIWDIKHSITDSNTVYVGTNDNGLYRTTNAGDSFEYLLFRGRAVNDMELYEDSTIIFASARDGIYEWHEYTEDLTLLSAGFSPAPSRSRRIILASCKSHPNILFCQLTDNQGRAMQGQYKSSDKGRTWTAFDGPDDIVGYNQAWYDLVLEVHPEDSNFLFAGGVRTAFSTDGGETWKEASYGHVDIHSLIWKENNTKFWVGSDGGLHEYFVSRPDGSVVSKNNGYNVTQFYAGHFFPEDAHTIGGTQDNNTLYGPNASSINTSILGGDGAYCFVSQQDDRLIYASWQNANLFRFENGPFGNRRRIDVGFKSTGENVWFINPYTINPNDGTQLYHTTYRGVWRSVDRGSTWDKITSPTTPGQFYSVSCSDTIDPVLYFGDRNALIYRIDNARTTQAGEEKSFLSNRPIEALNGFTGCIEINPQNVNSIVVGFTNVDTDSRIWKIVNTHTENFEWIDISGNLPSALPVNWVEIDPKDTNFIIAATDFGLYTTKDGGENWVKESTIPDVSIHQIRLRESDGQLYIYTHGRGIWMANIYDPTASVNPTASKAVKIKVYPNPASDRLQIQGLEGKVKKIEIMNMEGKVLINRSANEIDVSDLQPGVYLLRVYNSSESFVVKWLKR